MVEKIQYELCNSKVSSRLAESIPHEQLICLLHVQRYQKASSKRQKKFLKKS